MASKAKENEKNEKLIRGFLKQPGNRKCINCNALGPQYVCTTFSTFICATCGGIHREFTHRVKSVSMATFTQEEIASLKAGGNEPAKEIFFKGWDHQSQKSPDSSNMDKLRKFIKHVYVDRRYTGERSTDKPPRDDKKEPKDNKTSDPYQSGSRDLPYKNERRHSDRPTPSYDVRRSPGYDKDSLRSSQYGRSPVSSAIVSDWRREDRFSNGKKADDRSSSSGETKPEMKSSDSQNDSSSSSPSVVLPLSDILGEDVKPLVISEPSIANSIKVSESTVITQPTTAPSITLTSSNENPTVLKTETSLIDFDASPDPSMTASVTQVSQSAVPSTSTPSDDGWGCLVTLPENNVSQTPAATNQLESLLFDSVGGTSTTALSGALVISPFGGLSSSPSGVSDVPSQSPPMPVNGGPAQWGGIQTPQQPPVIAVNQPVAPQLVSAFPNGLSSQGVTGYPVTQAPQASHAVPQAPQAIPTPAAQALEANANRSQELPMDLFTLTYSATPYQGPTWQTGQLPVQYNTPMAMPTVTQPINSANPFGENAEASPSQNAVFPSVFSLHGALPNMGVHGGSGHHAPGLGGTRPSWTPPQISLYPSAVPHNGSSFTPAIPGAYNGQQQHNNMPPSRPQGFGSLNQVTTTPNPSLGGNPFG